VVHIDYLGCRCIAVYLCADSQHDLARYSSDEAAFTNTMHAYHWLDGLVSRCLVFGFVYQSPVRTNASVHIVTSRELWVLNSIDRHAWRPFTFGL